MQAITKQGTQFTANAVLASFFQGDFVYYAVSATTDEIGNVCMEWVKGGWAQMEITEAEFTNLQGEKMQEYKGFFAFKPTTETTETTETTFSLVRTSAPFKNLTAKVVETSKVLATDVILAGNKTFQQIADVANQFGLQPHPNNLDDCYTLFAD